MRRKSSFLFLPFFLLAILMNRCTPNYCVNYVNSENKKDSECLIENNRYVIFIRYLYEDPGYLNRGSASYWDGKLLTNIEFVNNTKLSNIEIQDIKIELYYPTGELISYRRIDAGTKDYEKGYWGIIDDNFRDISLENEDQIKTYRTLIFGKTDWNIYYVYQMHKDKNLILKIKLVLKMDDTVYNFDKSIELLYRSKAFYPED